jgi:hypothetical protein
MSTAAGAPVKSGVEVAGALLSYGPFSIGAIDYYSADVINIGYAETRYILHPSERLGFLLSMQYVDQRAVGDNSLTGSYFATRQFGVKSEASYQGAILSLAYTVAAKGADLQTPWGGYPGYTAVQVDDFDRAGEDAFLVKAAYDWAGLCLDGVSTYALFVHGWSRVDPSTGAPVPDEDEFDADFQWRPKIAMLDGLSFRTRYALVRQSEGDNDYIHDLRVIVNYDFSLM